LKTGQVVSLHLTLSKNGKNLKFNQIRALNHQITYKPVNEFLMTLFKEKLFYRKSIGGVTFIGNSAIVHFSGKIYF
jgi:saccharopine dehydrogenase-like NADP-dependent oxidoreductase